jgi:hypothetical protein
MNPVARTGSAPSETPPQWPRSGSHLPPEINSSPICFASAKRSCLAGDAAGAPHEERLGAFECTSAPRHRLRTNLLATAVVRVFLLVLFCVFVAAGCDSQDPEGDLIIEDLVLGIGDAAKRLDSLRVHYTGWREDGFVFDTSHGREPYSFRLGVGDVIQGWDEGLVGMRQGGRRRLTIPPHLAYGRRGIEGIIPPSATLIFEVDLLMLKPNKP